MQETNIIFAISILLLIIANIYQYRKNNELVLKLTEANVKLAQIEKSKEDILCIEPGDKGILPKYGLTWTATQSDGSKKKDSFTVTYEVDIIEVALNQLKVKATNVTPVDSEANKIISDPAQKADVLRFMENKWINKSDVQLVVDDVKRRNDKLNQILN